MKHVSQIEIAFPLKLKRMLCVCLCLGFLPLPVLGGVDRASSSEPIGFLEPTLSAKDGPPGTGAAMVRVVVHDKPDIRSSVLFDGRTDTVGLSVASGTKEAKPVFKTAEIDYESHAMFVYERTSDGWARIRLLPPMNRDGWIKTGAHLTYISIEKLLEDKEIGYLAESWDRQLKVAPEAKASVSLKGVKLTGAQSVRIRRVQRSGGVLWAEVQIVLSETCSAEKEVLGPRGWLPVLGPGAKFNVWFYPRGC